MLDLEPANPHVDRPRRGRTRRPTQRADAVHRYLGRCHARPHRRPGAGVYRSREAHDAARRQPATIGRCDAADRRLACADTEPARRAGPGVAGRISVDRHDESRWSGSAQRARRRDRWTRLSSTAGALLRWWRAGSLGDTEPVINSRSAVSSAPAGYRFPRQVIAVAVRWYLRYGLSYRDVEELLAQRGIVVDHVTACRGCRRSRPSSSTPREQVGTPWAIGGSSKRMSRLPAAGPTCPGPSISMGRSSTSWSASAEMRRLRGLSSSAR